MATVTGNLRDITAGLLETREGIILFTLNAVNILVGSGGVRPDNTREATMGVDGEFSINLEPTDSMALDAWYSVSVMWLEQSPNGEKKPSAMTGYLDIKIRVPAGGGRIDQLIDPNAGSGGGGGGANPNNRIVWVSQTAPSNPRKGLLWLEQEPGPTPDPFDPKNTSDLKEWQ